MTPLPPDHERRITGKGDTQILVDDPFEELRPSGKRIILKMNGRDMKLIEDSMGGIEVNGIRYREDLPDEAKLKSAVRDRFHKKEKTRTIKGREYHPTKGWR